MLHQVHLYSFIFINENLIMKIYRYLMEIFTQFIRSTLFIPVKLNRFSIVNSQN